MSHIAVRTVASAGVLLFALFLSMAPVRADALDDVSPILYVKTQIPLNVDAYLQNHGTRTVHAKVHWERYQGGKKLSDGDKLYTLAPGQKAYLGKALDSLVTTRFTIAAASYQPLSPPVTPHGKP